MFDIKKLTEDARKEVAEETAKKAKTLLVAKLRQLESAKQVFGTSKPSWPTSNPGSSPVRSSDPGILIRPHTVLWAGWETTTWRLQQAGWELISQQDFARGRIQLAMRHSAGRVYGWAESMAGPRRSAVSTSSIWIGTSVLWSSKCVTWRVG